MKRIIAVNSNTYHGYSIDQALDGIAAAGFHYVELTATKGWTEHVFPDQSFNQLEGVKQKMAALGLTAIGMSGHTNLMDTERLPDFIQNIRLAAFYGCRYIVSSIGEAHIQDNATSGNQQLAQNIKSLVPELEKHNMMLVLELHGEHSTGTIMKEIVELVASPLVKINYDTANCLFYGNVAAEQDIDVCMSETAYLHLKDKAGERTEWNFPALGKGYVDFPTLFAKLQKAENMAPYSIEIEFTPDGAENLEAVHQAVKDSAEYLIAQGYTL